MAAVLAACSSDAAKVPETSTTVAATPVDRPTTTRPLTTTQPASTTTTWHPDAPCTVSDLLVPSCGAWLGASTPSRDGKFDYTVGLAEYEADAGNPPDILHFYKKGGESFPTMEEVALSERAGVQRSILFYNWKPSTSTSWRAIANGAADDNIAAVAASLQRYDHRLFLAVWHEPENDPHQGTPADYVAMYRHVVGRLRELGVTNAVYVMNYMGFAEWKDVVDDFYPGNDVVDWIAYDPYGFADQPDLGAILDARAIGWSGFYTWATKKAPDIPIMLGEWGIDLARQPDAPAVLDGGAEILENRFPRIKALVYWNDHVPPDGVVVRLDEPTPLGRTYAAAYRRFATDPYFNSTDPSLAP